MIFVIVVWVIFLCELWLIKGEDLYKEIRKKYFFYIVFPTLAMVMLTIARECVKVAIISYVECIMAYMLVMMGPRKVINWSKIFKGRDKG